MSRVSARAKCDILLHRFLAAPTLPEAQRHFDRVYREHIGPTVQRVLTHNLRREAPATVTDLYRENDLFRDLEMLVRGKIAVRLFALWEQVSPPEGTPDSPAPLEPIAALTPYSASVARHACVDYLRRKYPGRHSLDTALRAILGASAEMSLWQAPLIEGVREWRCGRVAWETESLAPRSLRSDLALRHRLRSALVGGERADALPVIWSVVAAPLRYMELLAFLSDVWDVEAPYRMVAGDIESFPAPRAYLSGLRPEETADLMGTLQAVWHLVGQLSPRQAAVVLLKLPQYEAGTYLDAMVRMRITDWESIARCIDLPVQKLWRLSDLMPLPDETIAAHLGLATDDVARIRQDARRRMETLSTPQK